ncbi:MAG: glutamate 5-kinase [Sandaracinaceae bacterium]|nr:glutamate 5-kinase [Sandaracinaceae bacterium]
MSAPTPHIDLSTARQALADTRRIVVKIGSRSLMADGAKRYESLAKQLSAQHAAGRETVLVSSGAVAVGRLRLGMTERPKAIDKLQAAAATGQSRLMRAYEDAFDPYGVDIAQLLFTHADLSDRDRYLNARSAIDALLELNVIPIINENDTVSVDELRFSDNDQLAAMVANLAGADLLVLLTDVEGVLDQNGVRVSVATDTNDVVALVRPPTDDVGLGGMASKLEAARRATRYGVPVVIGDARDPDLIEKILAGQDVGTLILPTGTPLASRKHWIAYTLKPRGVLVVDRGAAKALSAGKVSLLPRGVIGVRGEFEAGDAVSIQDLDGEEIARGLARYGTGHAARLAGAKSSEISDRIGRHDGDVLVHKDDMVNMVDDEPLT